MFDKRGRVLAKGINSYSKTHPHQARLAAKVDLPEKMFLHAEVQAIIRAQRVGTPYSIHVERYSMKGEPAMAQPCPICMLAIQEAGIRKVSFTVG